MNHHKECFHRKACTCFSWFLPLVSITDKSYFSTKVLNTRLAAVGRSGARSMAFFLKGEERERILISISSLWLGHLTHSGALGIASQRRWHRPGFLATRPDSEVVKLTSRQSEEHVESRDHRSFIKADSECLKGEWQEMRVGRKTCQVVKDLGSCANMGATRKHDWVCVWKIINHSMEQESVNFSVKDQVNRVAR